VTPAAAYVWAGGSITLVAGSPRTTRRLQEKADDIYPRFAISFLTGLLVLIQPRAFQIRHFAAAATLPQTQATPVTIPATSIVLSVNQSSPVASDSNPGTSALPFLTIHGAAAQAVKNRDQGSGTLISIAPGVYREAIQIGPPASNTTSAPIVFASAGQGPVVVSGADVWTNWQPVDPVTYSAPWPYQWGLAPYPTGWQGQVVLPDIVRRREMIFVDGIPLQQVLTQSALNYGTFFVDETAGIVYIRPTPGLFLPWYYIGQGSST